MNLTQNPIIQLLIAIIGGGGGYKILQQLVNYRASRRALDAAEAANIEARTADNLLTSAGGQVDRLEREIVRMKERLDAAEDAAEKAQQDLERERRAHAETRRDLDRALRRIDHLERKMNNGGSH